MPRSEPETSTSRAGLAVAGAILDLVGYHVAHVGGDRAAALAACETVLREGKTLRSYQIDEVIEFVTGRFEPDDGPPGDVESIRADDTPGGTP